MSQLANFLEAQAESLVRRWTEEVSVGLAPGEAAEPELRDHLPDLLRELTASLRKGEAPAASAVAPEPAGRRHRASFNLERLVREYGVLRNLILDLTEEAKCPVTLAEVRVLTDFIARAVAEGVSEHARQGERAARSTEGSRDRLLGDLEAARLRLHGLFQNAPAFVCTLRGPMHVFELVNPPYQRLVGVGRKLIGLSVAQALPEIVGQAFIGLLDEVYRTGQPYIGRETPLRVDRQGNGELEDAFVNFVYQPMRNAHGDVDGIDVFGFEITDQVQARKAVEALVEKLRESEERLRRMVESSGAGLWELNVASGQIAADPRARTLMGLAPTESFTRSSALEEQIVPEDRALVGQAVSDALAGKNDGRYVTEFRTGGRGSAPLRWVESRAQAQFNAEGTPVQLEGAILDVTTRKSSELALKLRADFEQQLIGIVSHDLRNPIGAITMAAEILLRREDLEERQRKTLGRILSSAGRASRMIRDLLDFTQARLGGGLSIRPEAMDFHAFARQVLDEVRVTHPDRTLELEQSGEGAGTWDSDRLAQVLGNLLSNAIHYSPDATPVAVRTRTEPGEMVLEVHNIGSPIPAEVLPKLFEPMQRGLVPAEKARRSVGLGLFIVKSIVNGHGGTVEVTSTEAAGTTFTVRLPRRVGLVPPAK